MPLLVLPALMALVSQMPFAVDRKPLPRGEDWQVLLPADLGPYHRESLKAPTRDRDGEARYAGKGETFFLLFGKAPDARALRDILATVERESKSQPGQLIEEKVDLRVPGAYVLRIEKRGAFFAWARGTYYFSVETKGGKATLQAFLERFPY
ncbi:MAG TPA: hypothetical protein VJ486_01000 [Geothrix sp.]|nr:hypothetical protein [Geothrix sp.]